MRRYLVRCKQCRTCVCRGPWKFLCWLDCHHGHGSRLGRAKVIHHLWHPISDEICATHDDRIWKFLDAQDWELVPTPERFSGGITIQVEQRTPKPVLVPEGASRRMPPLPQDAAVRYSAVACSDGIVRDTVTDPEDPKQHVCSSCMRGIAFDGTHWVHHD